MKSKYTVREYGDYIITSLKEPYVNVNKVLSINVLAGYQDATTIGTISTTSNSTIIKGRNTDFNRLQPGTDIILGNSIYKIIQITYQNNLILNKAVEFTADDLQFYKVLDVNNQLEYEYRWSHNNQEFSEFKTNLENISTLFFNPEKPLWIDIKAEAIAISTASSITVIDITFEIENAEGIIINQPQFDADAGYDTVLEGLANIRTCTSDYFRPYDLTKNTHVYKQLVGVVNDIFGHDVTYFKTESDARSKDVFFMEYSLHNVIAKENIKIVVPDNEFPSEANTYDIFGMEFAEFEIHIIDQEFQKVFGFNATPRNKDYMYIPLINKMYEVESVAPADEFNKENSYWKVKLVKYQDRTSVNKGKFEDATNEFTTGVEDVFGAEQKQEKDKVTNPEQFKTISTSYKDGLRLFVNKQLSIKDYNLKNKWTVISKNYYDLNNITAGEIALEYNVKSKLNSNENLATTMWFKSHFKDNNSHFLFGDLAALNGFKIHISNTKLILTADTLTYTFTHNIHFNANNWYALVLNINNTSLQITCALYELDLSNNYSLAKNSSNLFSRYFETINIGQPLIWQADANYHLKGNNTYMTNIRLFNYVIEYEQHQNILNQYVVRDNQFARIIDNAVPSLGFQKFYNSK